MLFAYSPIILSIWYFFLADDYSRDWSQLCWLVKSKSKKALRALTHRTFVRLLPTSPFSLLFGWWSGVLRKIRKCFDLSTLTHISRRLSIMRYNLLLCKWLLKLLAPYLLFSFFPSAILWGGQQLRSELQFLADTASPVKLRTRANSPTHPSVYYQWLGNYWIKLYFCI